MEAYQSARKFGISIILLTLLFRLFELGVPQQLLHLRAQPAPPEIPQDTETGQDVRSLSVEAFFPFPFPYIAESSPPMDLIPKIERPHFAPEDAESVALTAYGCEKPELASLITQPLELELVGDEPTVLILHTHTTESYTKSGEDYTETAAYRTLDEQYNILSIGDRVTAILEQEGIRVIHDRQLHDYPSYNTAYTHARKAIQATLKEHPGIQLVLDLHRDAADSGGKQLRTTADIGGQTGAQLMLVMGCGNSGLAHPDWQKNLALAVKLHAILEQQCPGICRPISLRTQRFNQDLSPGTLLVEVGAAGNTHREAMLAAEQLAEAILALKYGADT